MCLYPAAGMAESEEPALSEGPQNRPLGPPAAQSTQAKQGAQDNILLRGLDFLTTPLPRRGLLLNGLQRAAW